MTPGPAAAATWIIEQFPIDGVPVDLEHFIADLALDEGWQDGSAAAQEAAEGWKPKVAQRLRVHLNQARETGHPSRFDFNSSDVDLIQGSSFVEPGDSPEIQGDKQARALMFDYLKLITSLTGREFEGVCRGVLEMLGCENPVLTQRGNDQGIDFYGRLEMAGRLERAYRLGSVDRAMRTWVIGQAKQVNAPVGTSEIRELAGSIDLARHSVNSDGGRALAELSLKPYDPVFGFFITTSRYSNDASRLISLAGFVALDGHSVAALLADHRIAEVQGACDAATFNQWLTRQLGSVDL